MGFRPKQELALLYFSLQRGLLAALFDEMARVD
jgi:hypothetical protein